MIKFDCRSLQVLRDDNLAVLGNQIVLLITVFEFFRAISIGMFVDVVFQSIVALLFNVNMFVGERIVGRNVIVVCCEAFGHEFHRVLLTPLVNHVELVH